MKKCLTILFILLLLASCGGKKAGPGQVTIDGKKVTLSYAFGVHMKKQGTYMVQLFNHDKVTCEIMKKGVRTVPKGEVNFRIFANEKSSTWNGVGIGAHTQIGLTVEIIKKPSKIGDTLELALPSEVEFKPRVGKNKGEVIKAVGLFKGKYCGETTY